MPDDDEAIRMEYESCPNCGADLKSYAKLLAECPLCGEEL
jgi:ribosomal protein S27AE